MLTNGLKCASMIIWVPCLTSSSACYVRGSLSLYSLFAAAAAAILPLLFALWGAN